MADRDGIDPFAQLMLAAYADAVADARMFMLEHGSPTTRLDKAHRFRSIVQASVGRSDRYSLSPEYMEFGRVQITDGATQQSYLIRNKSAMKIEHAVAQDAQLELFSPPQSAPGTLPSLLAYEFTPTGMGLWVCGTQTIPGKKRLAPSGNLEYVEFWAYDSATAPAGHSSGAGFDQGAVDPFDELGNPELDETDES